MANRTGPLTQAGGQTRAILSLSNLTADHKAIVQSLPKNPEQFLPSYYTDKPELIEGYKAQAALQYRMIETDQGLFEYTWSGTPRLGIILDKTLSRGTVLINSTNPHPATSPPLLDTGTLAHPFDAKLAFLGFKMARRYLRSPTLSRLEPVEIGLGTRITTDTEIETALREALVTPHNAHPCGTAAMLPRSLGGVVNPKLQVYGVESLRVIDASIIPVIPVAHLQATMYAVAEKAADIIRWGSK